MILEMKVPSPGESITEVEIAAVITYTRKAWGNDAGGDGEIVVISLA